MDKHQQHREEALRKLKVADHILTVSYPMVQDPKLLKYVMKNVHESVTSVIQMLLSYERKYKRIPPYPENIHQMLYYAKPVFERYSISEGYLNFVREINEFMEFSKKSDMEFIRKDKFVFASRDYDINTISEEQIRDYLAKAKLFIKQSIGVLEENERAFGIR